MTPKNTNESINDNIQAKALEKDPILELFEVGTKHLQNLENSIGSFLKEHGIFSDTENQELNTKINSYDGNLEGKNNNIEKIKIINQDIKTNKNEVIKHHLTMKMISEVMIANSKDNIDLLNILKANGKENLFGEIVKHKNEEINEYRKELYQINEKYKQDIGYVEPKTKQENRKEIGLTLQKNLQALSKNPNDTVVIKEFESNLQKSKEIGVYEDVKTDLGKYLEWSMQSGTLPLAMMANGTLRKALPMLPSVIGLGVWSRLMHGTVQDKAEAIGETALAIAPITGTYIAYKDAMNAKTTGDKIAAWTGFAVSAGFDAFTVFLVATGVGAPAAVGTQALKVTAKESAKLGVKKLVSFFTKKTVEEAPRAYGTLGQVTKDYFKGKLNVLTDAIKQVGIKEFSKKVGQQALKDTVEGMWNIISFKSIRETRLLNKANSYTFGKVAESTKGARVELFKIMEKSGLVKEGASKRAAMAGTIDEIKLIQHETQKANRPEEVTNQLKEESLSKISTKDLDGRIEKIIELIKSKEYNKQQLKDELDILKIQDQYMGTAMDVVKKITGEIDELNTKQIDIPTTVKNLENILKDNEGALSAGLKKYIGNVIIKVKNGESFQPNTGNYLLLLNKFNGQIGIAAYSKNPETKKEYYDLIKNGEQESRYGYAGNYLRTLDSLNTIIKTGELKGEKAKIILESYLDIIKNAEKTGWGTIRMELMDSRLKIDVENGKINNGYEYYATELIKNEAISDNILTILNRIDFSLIHSQSKLTEIVDKSFEKIETIYAENPEKAKEAIQIIKKLSGEKTGILLKDKFLGLGIVDGDIKGNNIIKQLANTNSNRELLTIIEYSNDAVLRQDIIDKIVKNIENNNQIIPEVGKEPFMKDGKLVKPMTNNELDGLLNDILKLKEIKLRNYRTRETVVTEGYKKAFDTIVIKITGDNPITRKSLYEFSQKIESHDVAANFIKLYSGRTLENGEKIDDVLMGTMISNIIKGKHASIEYKIKFLEKLSELKIEHIDDYIKTLSIELTKKKNSGNRYETGNNPFTIKIDRIEDFFNKNDNGNYTEVFERIGKLKETSEYKKQQIRINEALTLLLDLDRSHNSDFLRTLKNSGDITYKTLEKINKYIENKAIIGENGKIIKELDELEIKKLKIVSGQVEKALSKYEFTLFDNIEYKNSKNKEEYLYNIINQQSGWKLGEGAENADDLLRTITRQLNTIKSNFNIKPEVIDGFLNKIISSNNKNSLDVGSKIHLLKMLEKAGVISPSIEQKLEYVISIKAKDIKDLRDNTSIIKEYTKHFDENLKEQNEILIELGNNKEAIKEYVNKTKKDRVPVTQEYINSKTELREGIDYVKIDGEIYITKVYPSRYFISQLLSSNDIRQKETYMELIHNKNDFGGKEFKEYFKELGNSPKEIETKILMSYHDSIKYDPEVLALLKKYANNPEYSTIISYTLSKRKDFELIKGGEGEHLNKNLLDTIITKEYFESKEGKKISDKEFLDIKERLINLIISIKDIDSLKIGTRALNEAIPEIQNTDTLKGITELFIQNKSFINELLKDNALMSIILTTRGLDEILEESELGIKNSEKSGSSERKKIDEKINKYKKREETLQIARNTIENNKKLLTLPIIGKIIMDPTESQAAEQKIADTWEKSPKYNEYLRAMEAGDLKTAIEIKKATVNEITKVVLKDYIADFKDKYEAKYLARFQEFPLGLSDLTSQIHEKLSSSVKDKSEKGRNDFATSIYDFISHYNKEDGKAEKYAIKLLEKTEGVNGTPLAKLILDMGKQSDIEAAKSPEQKKKEYDEYMSKTQQKINTTQQKIDTTKQKIDTTKQKIDTTKQKIDTTKQKIEERNNIMKSLKAMINK